ncbi:MAG: septation protein IspZ [Acetobacteraceae bacterium]
MTNLMKAARLLLLDLASTFALLVVYFATHNMRLAAGCGIACGLIQIGRQFIKKRPIATMEYLSLGLVVVSATASLLTGDPRFIMLKPSLIYVAIGIVMLRPGWQNRYLPPVARETLSDVVYIFGFIWASLMFASAALNVVAALNFGIATWSAFMSLYTIVSKVGLFLVQYGVMRVVGARRSRTRVALVAS